MAAMAAQMMLQCVFDGSISIQDTEIERRPYHRNCSCALHNFKGVCSHAGARQRNISFPKKQSWTDCSLSIATSKLSSSEPSLLHDSSARNKVDENGGPSSHRCMNKFVGDSTRLS